MAQRGAFPMHRLLTAAVLLPLLASCGCSGLTPGGSTESSTNEGVYPPSSVIEGKTYSQWGDVWWKWFLEMPRGHHPALDETGADAGRNQTEAVWFLCGTVGTDTERACSVPAGKPLFFPINTTCCWTPCDAPTIGEVIRLTHWWNDRVVLNEAVLDGVALRGLNHYRFWSDAPFTFTGPANPDDCVFPTGAGTHEAFVDGYHVMLMPLSPGRHELSFHGKGVWPTTYPDTGVFELRVTYHLTVE
jgi:hypothetical protein